jgi:hypothetical protein
VARVRQVTANVALGADGPADGGALLALYGGAVRSLRRAEGEATVHASALLHGVGALASPGVVRYSLILFFR